MSEIPLAFRADVLGPLTDKLKGGYSCALVGVGSSGKSNVVRHLERLDVRQNYFGEQDAARVLYVYIDLDGLHSYSEHAAYAKLLQVLAEELSTLGGETVELQKTLDSQWHEVVTTPSELLAQTYLARAVGRVLDKHAAKLIFVLDDCDALVKNVPGAWLRNLRALRNDHKGELMYVTVSRKELSQLRADSPDFETFFELFSPHIIFVGPYQDADARGMITRLQSRNNQAGRQLTVSEVDRILELSGGHAGLITCIYQLTNRARDPQALDLMADNIVEQLSGKKLVRAECEKILDSLSSAETAALVDIANGKQPRTAAVQVLKRKGLVRDDVDGRRTIFSPLMRQATRRAASGGGSGGSASADIAVDPATRDVVQGDTRISLSPAEYELFVTLFAKIGERFTTGDLINHLMAVEAGGDPEGRLREHIKNLNARLQTFGLRIQTSPDGQYRLYDAGTGRSDA